MGANPTDGERGLDRDSPGDSGGTASLSTGPGPELTPGLEAVVRDHWWAAVAAIGRRTGDLEVAEDAVQEACAAAVAQWPRNGIPPNPRAWLIATAWHKAVDTLRRESVRAAREVAAAEGSASAAGQLPPASSSSGFGDDELALIFTCCHPALDSAVRVALTLRAVCGLATAEIAAAFMVDERAMAQRLVRAKRKIRQAGIPLTVPGADDLADRLSAVLRVVYLVFTEGHRATRGPELVRADLCEEAIRLARGLAALLPGEPEVTGLLALVLLTDARRPARTAEDGLPVLLPNQDRAKWDRAKIAEGDALITAALRAGRPGPYQIQAAIAACHSTAPSAEATDWREIAALYNELMRYEPTPVVAANRAVAVAMSEGPEEGLAVIDRLAADGRLSRWPQLHIARAELLSRVGRTADALDAYRAAIAAGLPPAERELFARRMAEIVGSFS